MSKISNPERVLVIACGALAHDLVRVRELNGWDQMDFQCLPAELHNYPGKIPEAVRNKIHENRSSYKEIFVAYSDCGTGGMLDKVLEQENVERLPGTHCYDMFASEAVFRELHEAELGTFYLTDFLAIHFQRLVIKGLGLDRFPELKEQFFGSYRKLVYLAQRDDREIDGKAREAAEYLGLDYERVATGDQHLESALSVRIGSIRDLSPKTGLPK
jgi:hypothetical protein